MTVLMKEERDGERVRYIDRDKNRMTDRMAMELVAKLSTRLTVDKREKKSDANDGRYVKNASCFVLFEFLIG